MLKIHFFILFILSEILIRTNGVSGYNDYYNYFFNGHINEAEPTVVTSPVLVLKDPSYFIIVPHVVRAGQIYRLVVNVLPPSPPLVVRVTLYKNNIKLDSVEKECDKRQPHLLQIMVPRSSTGGQYRLRLEGSEVGWLTGSAFTNETDLIFSPRGATVLIQTDKNVYKQGNLVRIRIIALDATVQMVDDSVDVFILSPRGVLVKRWLSRQCREGSITLEFNLSTGCELGLWSVRVETTNSFSEAEFKVEFFENSLFEVSVDVPAFLTVGEKYLEGRVTANYSSGAPVSGNVLIRGSLRPLTTGSMAFYRTENKLLRRKSKFNGEFKFRFRLDEMGQLLEWTEGVEVKITATVGDGLWDVSQTGFSSVRIFGQKIVMKFLGDSPFIFRPSMPFKFYLTAALLDGSHVSGERLFQHRLQVTPEVRLKTTKLLRLPPRFVKMIHNQYGVWKDEIDLASELGDTFVENNIESLTLNAELKDSLGHRAHASLVAIPYYSPKGKELQVSTSTKKPKVGEYIIFHVRSNFYLEKFRYILLSKGVIIESGQEEMEASVKTFPIALTPAMAGTSSIIIYAIERGQELVAHSITFPVDAIVAKNLKVYVDEQKYLGRIKVTVTGEPGTRVSLTGSYASVYKMHGNNYPTKMQVTEQLITDSKPYYARGIPTQYEEPLTQKWLPNGGHEMQYIWLPKPSSGSDANETFSSLGIDILSDGGIPTRPMFCKPNRGLLPCLINGCFATSGACDGKFDCTDRIDEKRCQTRISGIGKSLSDYNINRDSRMRNHFTSPWLWSDLVINQDGVASVSVMTPEKTCDLVLSAFGLHQWSGISVLKKPIEITTSPLFWLWVEVPNRVVIWEQVGIRVTLVNRQDKELPAIIVLTNNPSYRFVSLEDFEIAQTFNTPTHMSTLPEQALPIVPVHRMLTGEHEHTIYIPAREARTVYLPIVPVVTGEITVIVQATLPGSKETKTVKLYAEPIGALQEQHTSLLLDMSNRAYLFTFLDLGIPTEGKYHNSQLSLFGDTVSGVSDNLAGSEELLRLPQFGSESAIFGFLLSVLQLSQWQRMNQRPEKNEKEIFSQLSTLYQNILSYQNNDGGFKDFETSGTSSVWITSLALRALNEVTTNWPHLLYIDPQVTDNAIRFLLKHQSIQGAFWEPDGSVGIRYIDQPTNYALNQLSTKGLNLSSSAFALMHLISIKELHLPEPLDEKVKTAIDKGRNWLEENLKILDTIAHPLEIAIVTLLLHLTNSKKAEDAFNILSRNARQEVKYLYWGEELVSLPSYRVESQRPHLQPRKYHRHDSGNIAATACALRVYALRGELLTPSIVRWLQAQRGHDGGWMSTLDTLLAWESLNEYSTRTKHAKHTHLTVTMETMNNRSSKAAVFYITPDNILHLQNYKIRTNNSVRIQGKGGGSAVLQLTSRYYVTKRSQMKRPPENVFSLGTQVISSGRNSSTLTFHSCVMWKRTGHSGIAVLEVGIPTGYGITENELRNYVSSRKVPQLKTATFRPRKVTFFFDKIERKNTCVKFSVSRWFPVANLTKLLVVKVYEYYSPESFEDELLDMSSIILDICQVCGSYQCPNCPILSYYSSRGSCQKVYVKQNIFYLLFLYVTYHYIM